MMSSSSSAFSPEHQLYSTNEQLCYVHCNCCDTVLAVSVPCSSLFKTVTVRCGHCTNLLSVNMRGLLFPAANQLQLGHTFFTPQNLLEEIRNATPNLIMNQNSSPADPIMQLHGGINPIPKPPTVNRPPEKRQRVPSAYNRFIKEEIQRIKAGNPDISHREAFSAAAKNGWLSVGSFSPYPFRPDAGSAREVAELAPAGWGGHDEEKRTLRSSLLTRLRREIKTLGVSRISSLVVMRPIS